MRRALEDEKQGSKEEDKKFKDEGKVRLRQRKEEDIKIKKGPEQEASVDNSDVHPSRRSRMAV